MLSNDIIYLHMFCLNNIYKNMLIRVTSHVVLWAFLFNTIAAGLAFAQPANPRQDTLAVQTFTQRPDINLSALAALYRNNRIIQPAKLTDKRWRRILDKKSALAMLFGSGRYLMREETYNDDLKLVRAVTHEDYEILTQRYEKEDPADYAGLTEKISGNDRLKKAYHHIVGRRIKKYGNAEFNDLIARVFELRALIEERLVAAGQLKADEIEFYELAKPLLETEANFPPVFFNFNERLVTVLGFQKDKKARFYRTTSAKPAASEEGKHQKFAEMIKDALVSGKKLKGRILLLEKDDGDREISIGVFSRMGLKVFHPNKFKSKQFKEKLPAVVITIPDYIEEVRARDKSSSIIVIVEGGESRDFKKEGFVTINRRDIRQAYRLGRMAARHLHGDAKNYAILPGIIKGPYSFDEKPPLKVFTGKESDKFSPYMFHPPEERFRVASDVFDRQTAELLGGWGAVLSAIEKRPQPAEIPDFFGIGTKSRFTTESASSEKARNVLDAMTSAPFSDMDIIQERLRIFDSLSADKEKLKRLKDSIKKSYEDPSGKRSGKEDPDIFGISESLFYIQALIGSLLESVNEEYRKANEYSFYDKPVSEVLSSKKKMLSEAVDMLPRIISTFGKIIEELDPGDSIYLKQIKNNLKLMCDTEEPSALTSLIPIVNEAASIRTNRPEEFDVAFRAISEKVRAKKSSLESSVKGIEDAVNYLYLFVKLAEYFEANGWTRPEILTADEDVLDIQDGWDPFVELTYRTEREAEEAERKEHEQYKKDLERYVASVEADIAAGKASAIPRKEDLEVVKKELKRLSAPDRAEEKHKVRMVGNLILPGEVVKNSFHFDKDHRAMIVTGPNMDGKTVAIETALRINELAQMGFYVPAQKARLSIRRKIIYRSPRQGSIEHGLSSFGFDVDTMRSIKRDSGKGVLIGIDELGRHTNSTDGSALAYATLKEVGQNGAHIIAATHFSNLTELDKVPGFENWHMDYEIRPDGNVELKCKLIPGSGESKALTIARALGLPEELAEVAEARLNERLLRSKGIRVDKGSNPAYALKPRDADRRTGKKSSRQEGKGWERVFDPDPFKDTTSVLDDESIQKLDGYNDILEKITSYSHVKIIIARMLNNPLTDREAILERLKIFEVLIKDSAARKQTIAALGVLMHAGITADDIGRSLLSEIQDEEDLMRNKLWGTFINSGNMLNGFKEILGKNYLSRAMSVPEDKKSDSEKIAETQQRLKDVVKMFDMLLGKIAAIEAALKPGDSVFLNQIKNSFEILTGTDAKSSLRPLFEALKKLSEEDIKDIEALKLRMIEIKKEFFPWLNAAYKPEEMVRIIKGEEVPYEFFCMVTGKIESLQESVYYLESFAALADYFGKEKWSMPVVVPAEEQILDIVDGWHPIIAIENPGKIVKNSIRLDKDNRVMLLTGSNMDGKSCALQMAVIMQSFAQAGFFVPAASCKVSIVDKIIHRTPGKGSIEHSISSFGEDVEAAKFIDNEAGPYTLVAVDEPGRSTNPMEGDAVAWAVSKKIVESGARGVVVTHFEGLRELERFPGVAISHVETGIDKDGKVKLTYKIKPGFDTSDGIAIAEMMGLSARVVSAAKDRKEELWKRFNISNTGPPVGAAATLSAVLADSVNRLLSESGELTKDKISKLHKKFGASSPEERENICEKLWEACKDAADEELTKSVKSGQEITELKKIPVVVAAPAVGLDFETRFEFDEEGRATIASRRMNPGGSPSNVIRALHNLGSNPYVVGLYGSGARGEIFKALLDNNKVYEIDEWLKIVSDTAFHYIVTADGMDYRLIQPSPSLTDAEYEEFFTRLDKICGQNEGAILEVSSRPPQGAPVNFIARMIETGKRHKMFVLYDPKPDVMVNDELRESIFKAKPDMIKPNMDEFAKIFKMEEKDFRGRGDIIDKARDLIAQYGIRMVLVSLGREGALLIDKDRIAYAKSPGNVLKSPVGAGDASIASMLQRWADKGFAADNITDDNMKELVSAFVSGGSAIDQPDKTKLVTREAIAEMERQVAPTLKKEDIIRKELTHLVGNCLFPIGHIKTPGKLADFTNRLRSAAEKYDKAELESLAREAQEVFKANNLKEVLTDNIAAFVGELRCFLARYFLPPDERVREEVAIRDVLRTAISSPAIVMESAELEIARDMMLTIDEGSLWRGLSNIAVNAEQAVSSLASSAQKGSVKICIDKEGENTAVIRFMIDGSGLREELLKEAFDINAPSRDYLLAKGLGMAKREIEENCKGSIAVELKEGQRVEITIRIPMLPLKKLVWSIRELRHDVDNKLYGIKTPLDRFKRNGLMTDKLVEIEILMQEIGAVLSDESLDLAENSLTAFERLIKDLKMVTEKARSKFTYENLKDEIAELDKKFEKGWRKSWRRAFIDDTLFGLIFVNNIMSDFFPDLREKQKYTKLYPLIETSLRIDKKAGRASRDYGAGDIEIFTDEIALFRALLNILDNASNAIVENHGKGRIRVATRLSQDKKFVYIEVLDTVGSMPIDKEAAFNGGEKVTSSQAGKGHGLGLGIVRECIEKRCGGTVSVAVEPGKHTIFTIHLPLGNPTAMKEKESIRDAFGRVAKTVRSESRINSSISELGGQAQNVADIAKLKLCIPIEEVKNSADLAIALGKMKNLADGTAFELVVTGVKQEDVKLIEGLNRADIKAALGLPDNVAVSIITEDDIVAAAERYGYDANDPLRRAQIIKDMYVGALGEKEYLAVVTSAVDKDKAVEIEKELKVESKPEDRISFRVLQSPGAGRESMFSLAAIISDWFKAIRSGENSSIKILLPALVSPDQMMRELGEATKHAWKVLAAA